MTSQSYSAACKHRTFNLAPVREQLSSADDVTDTIPQPKQFSASTSYLNLANAPKVSFPLPVHIVENKDNVRGSRVSHTSKCIQSGISDIDEENKNYTKRIKLPKPFSTDLPTSNVGVSRSYPRLPSHSSTGNLYNFPRYSSAASSSQISTDSAYVSDTSSLISRLSNKSPSKTCNSCTRTGTMSCNTSFKKAAVNRKKERTSSDTNVKMHYMQTSQTCIPTVTTSR